MEPEVLRILEEGIIVCVRNATQRQIVPAMIKRHIKLEIRVH